MANLISALLSTDIVLDREAFQRASSRLSDLTAKINELDDQIEDMLKLVEQGLDTPAGRKLVNVGRKHLREPIEDQRKVIEHISETLNDVRNIYESVFTEYSSLNAKLKK